MSGRYRANPSTERRLWYALHRDGFSYRLRIEGQALAALDQLLQLGEPCGGAASSML